MARNPRAYIRLRGRNFDFRCYLGNSPATITGGGAQFEEGRRPQADGVTLFSGNALVTLDVPILFDGWPDKNIEPHVDQVLNLCRGQGRKPPPNFIATGPIPYSGMRFNMQMPEDGGALYAEDGTMVRRYLTLKLIEYNDPTSIEYRRQRFGHGPTITQPSSIVLDHPMTLLQIASQYFGDPGEATRIGKLNGIADVRKKLKAGTRIKLGLGSELSVAGN